MKVNGEYYDYQAQSISDLLKSFGLAPETVVAEVNGKIVAKAQFDSHIVDKEAVVELVAFVGGG
jgi:thiamine biosynthesis protein ThiS